MSTVEIIELNCPACRKPLKIKAEMAGQRLTCPKQGCGASIDVPGSAKTGLGLNARLMIAVGIVFALIAVILTIQQVELPAGWIVVMALVAAVVVSQFFASYARIAGLAIFTVIGLSTPALFFILDRRGHDFSANTEWAFYFGSTLFFVASAFCVFRSYSTWSQFKLGDTEKLAINLESGVVWFALIASSIAFSWVTYYQFFTPMGQQEWIVRRLVFTLFFVVVGVICSVLGRNSLLPFLGITGLIYMAAGVVKALAYDLTHTSGLVRIGVFAGCGVVLLLGGFLMMKKAPRTDASAASASAFIED